jgi:hypothetical protein
VAKAADEDNRVLVTADPGFLADLIELDDLALGTGIVVIVLTEPDIAAEIDHRYRLWLERRSCLVRDRADLDHDSGRSSDTDERLAGIAQDLAQLTARYNQFRTTKESSKRVHLSTERRPWPRGSLLAQGQACPTMPSRTPRSAGRSVQLGLAWATGSP